MNTQIIKEWGEVVARYYKVKESILYGFPLHWGSVEETRRAGVGHCGAKAEVLAREVASLGYNYQYVIGYDVDMLPKFLLPKFLDVHIWLEVLVDGSWLTLDPSPDSAAATGIGDTEPGTHLCNPKYITRMGDIPPWYRDVYNNWSVLPYKILVNLEIVVRRWKLNMTRKLKEAMYADKQTRSSTR